MVGCTLRATARMADRSEVIGVPVSVIVTAGGSTHDFQALLASLRPTLRLRDEVVCVLPPQRSDLAAKARGLSGVQLVISDAHTGLKAAIAAVMAGAAWQRCRVQ